MRDVHVRAVSLTEQPAADTGFLKLRGLASLLLCSHGEVCTVHGRSVGRHGSGNRGVLPSPPANFAKGNAYNDSRIPCRTNHLDGQIFTPPYLLNPDSSLATRPNITMAPPSTALPGDVLTVVTDTLIASFSIIRRGCEACSTWVYDTASD